MSHQDAESGGEKIGEPSLSYPSPPPYQAPLPQDLATGIHVVAKHNPLAVNLRFTKLTIEIDGERDIGSWGDRSIVLTPGRHVVRIYFRYGLQSRCGEAEATVDVVRGAVAPLSYKAPKTLISRGRITRLDSIG